MSDGIPFRDAEHPRWPKGTSGGRGGKFMQAGERVAGPQGPGRIAAIGVVPPNNRHNFFAGGQPQRGRVLVAYDKGRTRYVPAADLEPEEDYIAREGRNEQARRDAGVKKNGTLEDVEPENDELTYKSAKDVGPHARDKLHGLLEYYAKKPHPFTACVHDNMKRFGPGRTEAVCATLKDIIRGTTHWRGHPSEDHGAAGLAKAMNEGFCPECGALPGEDHDGSCSEYMAGLAKAEEREDEFHEITKNFTPDDWHHFGLLLAEDYDFLDAMGGAEREDLDDGELPLRKSGFNEADHPRVPGGPGGGRFKPKVHLNLVSRYPLPHESDHVTVEGVNGGPIQEHLRMGDHIHYQGKDMRISAMGEKDHAYYAVPVDDYAQIEQARETKNWDVLDGLLRNEVPIERPEMGVKAIRLRGATADRYRNDVRKDAEGTGTMTSTDNMGGAGQAPIKVAQVGGKEERRKKRRKRILGIARQPQGQVAGGSSGSTDDLAAADGGYSGYMEPGVQKDVGEFAITKAKPEMRYTFGPLYSPGLLDAHNEFTTDEALHKAVIDFNRSGKRALYKQHNRLVKAGEIVEGPIRWPHEATFTMEVPSGPGGLMKSKREVTLPAGTAYMGVIWTPEAWEDVKAGKLTGFSLGGRGVKVRGIEKELPRMREAFAKQLEEFVAKATGRPPMPPSQNQGRDSAQAAAQAQGVSPQQFDQLHPRAGHGQFGAKPDQAQPGQQPPQPPPNPGNPRVHSVQAALQHLGYDLGPAGVDGIFGPATHAAVEKFQKEHGLQPTGVIGPNTMHALTQALASGKGKNSKTAGGAHSPAPNAQPRTQAEQALAHQIAQLQHQLTQLRQGVVSGKPAHHGKTHHAHGKKGAHGKHPGVNAWDTGQTQTEAEVAAHGLKWGNRTFSNVADFKVWLDEHGATWDHFVAEHPEAARGLEAHALESSKTGKKPAAASSGTKISPRDQALAAREKKTGRPN